MICVPGLSARPLIVWFSEAVPEMEHAIDIVQNADIFLIIGTSLQVYPAAGLLNYVASQVPVFMIDPNEVGRTYRRKITRLKKGQAMDSKELKELLKIFCNLVIGSEIEIIPE